MNKGMRSVAMSAREARERCRRREFTGPTAGIAPGHVQANLVILPGTLADAFEAYCRANPRPCPLLERLDRGSPVPRRLAPGADVRTDLPRYLVHRREGSPAEVLDVLDEWAGDSTAFLLGCSFGFEEELAQVGLVPRHWEERCSVPMYRTDRPTQTVGPFDGPLVVSMRPLPRERVAEARDVTRRHEAAHGAPLHAEDPAALGIGELASPDWGHRVTLRPDEVPVFWACGVTSQVALSNALRRGACDRAITHAPGHMLVCDPLSRDFRDERGIVD